MTTARVCLLGTIDIKHKEDSHIFPLSQYYKAHDEWEQVNLGYNLKSRDVFANVSDASQLR